MKNAVVDFHGHWFPPAVIDGPPPTVTPAMAKAWPLLSDLDAQLEQAGPDVLKVVCAPLSSVRGPDAPADLDARLNDALAAGVADRHGRLLALASVDAYAGDAGAREAERATTELGLPGIVVDCADGETLLSAPEARPTLAYAAEHGIPVFAHPVTPAGLGERFRHPGAAGILLARGTESALSTLALLNDGVLDDLPGLQLVIAGIGAGALLLSAFTANGVQARGRLHVDTMGFDPKVVAFLADTLGPEHVLVGSDWPIMSANTTIERVTKTLRDAGLDERDATLVSGGNARRLLRPGA